MMMLGITSKNRVPFPPSSAAPFGETFLNLLSIVSFFLSCACPFVCFYPALACYTQQTFYLLATIGTIQHMYIRYKFLKNKTSCLFVSLVDFASWPIRLLYYCQFPIDCFALQLTSLFAQLERTKEKKGERRDKEPVSKK
jgi:hypothetical protein